MPIPISALTPDAMPYGGGNTWAQILHTNLGITAAVLTAALIAATTMYVLMRRPGRADFSKHLMYVPLLLVNAAAVYGQVAFFYEKVAPAGWPIPGKVALSLLIAAGIESVAVYVGWHAHDALLMKATATAARLRRASYGLAAFVGFINYWHFTTDYKVFSPTAASFAFGLLSLISPWLWGLHTRRIQHKQLTREGAVDATGATFSMERIRSFPVRAYLARRWSIDHYVTDPRQAWEGYNAELRARWASTTDRPGWWARTNPYARVRQLTAGLPEMRKTITDLTVRVEEAETLRVSHAGLEDTLRAVQADLAAASAQRDEALRARNEVAAKAAEELEAVTSEAASAASKAASEITELRSSVADLEEKIEALRADYEARLRDAEEDAQRNLRDVLRESSDTIRQLRAELAEVNRKPRGGAANLKPSNRAKLTDEEAVQRLLEAPPDPARGLPGGGVREWSQQAIVDTLRVGWDRSKRLVVMVAEAQQRRTTDVRPGGAVVVPPTTPITGPRRPVTSGVNGNHPTFTEETR